VSGIQFSPDGRHIATAFKYGHLAVWDARDLRQVASINLDWFEVTGMDYSKDGTRCAVVLTKGTYNLDNMMHAYQTAKTCIGLGIFYWPRNKTNRFCFFRSIMFSFSNRSPPLVHRVVSAHNYISAFSLLFLS